MYSPIEIDRINLTLMGVKFPDLKTLENTDTELVQIGLKALKPIRQGSKNGI
jgi:hypothetical protein